MGLESNSTSIQGMAESMKPQFHKMTTVSTTMFFFDILINCKQNNSLSSNSFARFDDYWLSFFESKSIDAFY